ncbi:uncharacterized protein LOC115095679 [Rhinatrema bivittatum]|uniref:uncharacterized protein LOC115095679 n=1 Tax=Rhinatrema bivittatum TaxID=194408 RepID=UPI001128CC3B|nr:uncharacterized protein LOC115095679 [Rhinatrema bivittatum]
MQCHSKEGEGHGMLHPSKEGEGHGMLRHSKEGESHGMLHYSKEGESHGMLRHSKKEGRGAQRHSEEGEGSGLAQAEHIPLTAMMEQTPACHKRSQCHSQQSAGPSVSHCSEEGEGCGEEGEGLGMLHHSEEGEGPSVLFAAMVQVPACRKQSPSRSLRSWRCKTLRAASRAHPTHSKEGAGAGGQRDQASPENILGALPYTNRREIFLIIELKIFLESRIQ